MELFKKPRLLEKFRSFHKYVSQTKGKIGTKQRGIDLNFNNACNLKCEYCFTNSPKGDHAKDTLPVSKVAEIANQADELGIFEFDLQGGELLLRPDKLFEVLEAIKPERFYLYLTTNGYFLDEAMAQKLAKAGVSRVSVSVDSIHAETHDKIRGKKDSWRRAMEGLKNVQAAGIDPYLNITVGHYNAFSDDIKQLCQYSEDHNYTTLINVAVPSGMWLKIDKMTEVMVDENDKARLIELRKKHKNILRNIWNPFDKNYENILGCNTVNRLYITPLGDVLVCPYVHIKIGNVFQQTLKEISEFGFKIKHFHDHSDLCLAGENKDFVKKFMSFEGQSIFHPADAKQIFKAEDYVAASTEEPLKVASK
ncbi:MAG: radical SAM protein [Deltaproteobacteria bacterium]|nr:radical SAM protein [Deltaproteobacteria bacterium]MBI3295797.1 radical SAM protein [Deltaproteobacteria bacterium]